MAGRPSEDIFVKKLKHAVEQAKQNREWRVLDIRGDVRSARTGTEWRKSI